MKPSLPWKQINFSVFLYETENNSYLYQIYRDNKLTDGTHAHNLKSNVLIVNNTPIRVVDILHAEELIKENKMTNDKNAALEALELLEFAATHEGGMVDENVHEFCKTIRAALTPKADAPEAIEGLDEALEETEDFEWDVMGVLKRTILSHAPTCTCNASICDFCIAHNAYDEANKYLPKLKEAARRYRAMHDVTKIVEGYGWSLLIDEARHEAQKAMTKFPQPNYVITKIAEEAGEVVKAAVHCAEKRETLDNLRGEMVQLIAMIYRLYYEGDQVHGLPPVFTAAISGKGGGE